MTWNDVKWREIKTWRNNKKSIGNRQTNRQPRKSFLGLAAGARSQQPTYLFKNTVWWGRYLSCWRNNFIPTFFCQNIYFGRRLTELTGWFSLFSVVDLEIGSTYIGRSFMSMYLLFLENRIEFGKTFSQEICHGLIQMNFYSRQKVVFIRVKLKKI